VSGQPASFIDRMNEPAPADPPAPRRRGRPRQEGPSAAFLARQAEIVDVAIECFRERGFEQGSLDDVAASLGTGRASLYHYVKSKPHLLYLIFDRAISTTLETMEQLMSIEDPTERLRALMRQQVLTIASDPGLFIVFFGDRPALDHKYEAEIRPKERRLLRYLIEAVKAASAAGAISTTDPRMAAQAILGMTSWFHKWYDPERDDPAAFAEVCERLVFDGRPPQRPATRTKRAPTTD
jgi:TetR/AcrR family transcriptional regulator, cholesterol catabolism regulator